MVKRYVLERTDYEDFDMVEDMYGDYVEYSDYAFLERMIETLTSQRDDLIEKVDNLESDLEYARNN